MYPANGEVYSIYPYVIKFVSDLSQVGGFLQFPLPIKLNTNDFFKVRKMYQEIVQPIVSEKKEWLSYYKHLVLRRDKLALISCSWFADFLKFTLHFRD
jgi:hypothetical protein